MFSYFIDSSLPGHLIEHAVTHGFNQKLALAHAVLEASLIGTPTQAVALEGAIIEEGVEGLTREVGLILLPVDLRGRGSSAHFFIYLFIIL